MGEPQYEPDHPGVAVAVALRREIAEFQRLGSNGKQVLREALTEACMAALCPDGDGGCLDEHPAVQYLARHGFVRQLRCPLQPVPVMLRPPRIIQTGPGLSAASMTTNQLAVSIGVWHGSPV